MIFRRPVGRRKKKIPKILLQQHHQQPTDDDDDDDFFPLFPQKNTIIFDTTKILQTLKRPGGRVQVPSGIKNLSPLHSHNCLFIFTPKPNLT